MTFNLKCVILFCTFVNPSISQRRIVNGSDTTSDKRYLVYLVKSRDAKVAYDAWLCGGVIVTKTYIVTSAACIEDVQYMYAIAGYNKYVNGDKIYSDPCTSATMKKIVMTCVPKPYNFAYEQIKRWATLDIAIAEVESPYDFNDQSYIKAGCSYIPDKIDINFEEKYQNPGTDAVVLGWGHTEKFRTPQDTTDYNHPNVLYASVLIVKKSVCQSHWPAELSEMIEKYMICTFGQGLLDDDGRSIVKNVTDLLVDGCRRNDIDCTSGVCLCGRVRHLDLRTTDPDTNPSQSTTQANTNTQNTENTKGTPNDHTSDGGGGLSPGFCQNDHGGPLIGWVGGRQVLLGVQSAFLLDPANRCMGPFIYTSTHCNGAFLDCVISKGTSRRRDCNAESKGFTLLRRNISWKRHQDGAALNEKYFVRPQTPIHPT